MKKLDLIVTKEFLSEHYIELRKSTDQIGFEVGCSGRMIRYYLKKYNIPTGGIPPKPSPNSGRFKKGNRSSTQFKKGDPSPLKGHTKHTHEAIARAAAAKRGKKRPDVTGPRNPNWKGGILAENIRIRNSPEYKEWRTAVFKRDNFTCQQCGERGVRLEAHHVASFADHPELRMDINNGITLCFACHRNDPEHQRVRKFSLEQRHEMSKIRKGKKLGPTKPHGPMSPEHKAKVSAAKKGTPSWNKGLTKETSESIMRVSEKARKRMQGKKGKDSPVWKRWHPDDEGQDSTTPFQADPE